MELSPSMSSAAVAFLALGLDGWLWWRSRGGRALPGCGAGSGCDAVLSSRWSRWLGIPVTIPAAVTYLATAGAALAAGHASSPAARSAAEQLLRALSLAIAGTAVWFVLLQVLVVRRVCAYCLALHGIAIGLAIAGMVPRWGAGAVRGDSHVPEAAAAAGVLIIVAGQVFVRPRLYVITPTDAGDVLPDRAVAPPDPGPPVRTDSRQATFMSGRIRLSIGDWPILGDPDAPSVVAYLFDYTCPTCRKGHRALAEALELCGPDIALLLVPAPVDPTCNPHVTRRHATHAFACRFARLGLDVWRRGRASFAAYDRWVFEPAEPPAIGLARAFAERSVGVDDMDPSVPDGELDRLIAQGVATYRASGAGGMPTLLFRDAVLRGELPPTAELARIIRGQVSPVRIVDPPERVGA
jgi:uncharacterized membrane protein